MSTLSATNLKNASSSSNNIVLGTGGDTTITNNLTVSGTGNHSIAGTLQFNSGYGSVATAYGCRAWVNFNGTGVVAIRASGNVSSITDNGTGDYTVNFTTAMPDANYAVTTVNNQDSGQTAARCFAIHAATDAGTPTTMTTSAVRLFVRAASNADSSTCNVAIFR